MTPRRNRVDPWGDLVATSDRGLFTGNRGCLVDGRGEVVRHHRSSAWIVCSLEFGGRRVPLAQPGVWTPIFFLDDAVALAAGHRPCGRCRRADYLAYQRAVSPGPEGSSPLPAGELDRRLAGERLRPGQGLERREDRRLWKEPAAELPDGTVIVHEGTPHLLVRDRAFAFSFAGWGSPRTRPEGTVDVLTPPTSVAALRRGFRPRLHRSATDQLGTWTPMEMR